MRWIDIPSPFAVNPIHKPINSCIHARVQQGDANHTFSLHPSPPRLHPHKACPHPDSQSTTPHTRTLPNYTRVNTSVQIHEPTHPHPPPASSVSHATYMHTLQTGTKYIQTSPPIYPPSHTHLERTRTRLLTRLHRAEEEGGHPVTQLLQLGRHDVHAHSRDVQRRPVARCNRGRRSSSQAVKQSSHQAIRQSSNKATKEEITNTQKRQRSRQRSRGEIETRSKDERCR